MTCCDQRCALITGAVLGALIAVLGGILIPVGNMVIEDTVNTVSRRFCISVFGAHAFADSPDWGCFSNVLAEFW